MQDDQVGTLDLYLSLSHTHTHTHTHTHSLTHSLSLLSVPKAGVLKLSLPVVQASVLLNGSHRILCATADSCPLMGHTIIISILQFLNHCLCWVSTNVMIYSYCKLCSLYRNSCDSIYRLKLIINVYRVQIKVQ